MRRFFLAAVAALLLAVPAASAAPLTVATGDIVGPQVPASFLGLSFEVNRLAQIAPLAGKGNLVGYLRSLGPGVMRFGGVTADSQMAWVPPGGKLPPWATGAVTPQNFVDLASLMRAAGWRAIVDVNLGHFDPKAAAGEVASAQSALGPALAGIEIGNEPNAYNNHGLRTDPWTFNEYANDVAAYRQAIDAAAPGWPLAGPGPTSGNADWLFAEAQQENPALLTAHFYSLNCIHPPLTIPRLLGSRVRKNLSNLIRRFGFVTSSMALPLRISETNNISCGGKAGVSNSFASALWATDLITQSMRAGLAGINFHGHPTNCFGYAPLCWATQADFDAGHFTAQPEWYALLLGRSLIGDRPLRTFVRNRRPGVNVTAFQSPNGVRHVVVVDERPHHDRPLPVTLSVSRRFTSGTIERLTGRLPSSTSGVTLGGRAVAPDGSWAPAPNPPRLGGARGHLKFTVPAGSAALVTLRSRGD